MGFPTPETKLFTLLSRQSPRRSKRS